MFSNLDDDNFLLYAIKNYEGPHMLQSEFEEDIKRIKYLKRLIRKYKQTGEFKDRLILNHIIVLSNVFGIEATVNMLFLKVDSEDYPVLKTLLIFLNYLPDELKITFKRKRIHQKEIPIDLIVANILRKT